MIIQQYKRSPIAMAPDEVAKCINKYTQHTSFVDSKIHQEAGLIHFHNTWGVTTQRQLITYHSEPERVNRNFPKFKSVIAQYHATLPEYSGFYPIRNIIDFYQDMYRIKQPETFRIGFSPSVKTKVNKWYNKGYEETKIVLEDVQKITGAEIDIITGVPLQEAIQRKSECSVVIDECVTPSYHRSSLEGLSLGKMTICSISDEVQDIVRKSAGDLLPVENVGMDCLKTFLLDLVEKYTIEDLFEMGKERRAWMEEYWNPENVIKDYLRMYKGA